jgi:hypothetical protein
MVASSLNPTMKRWLLSRLGRYDTFHSAAEARILNYTFVVNTGSLAATVSAFSGANPPRWLETTILLFSSGTLFTIIHALWTYFVACNHLKVMSEDVRTYLWAPDPSPELAQKIQSEDAKRTSGYPISFLWATLAVASAVAGIAFSALQISRTD